MRHGPVDVLVLAFGEPHADGSIGEELRRLADAGTIRVLDAMFMMKADDGQPVTLDIEDLPEEERRSYGFIETGTRGLFDSQDAEALMEGMAPGSALVALAIEHAWAVGLRDALERVGGELAMDVRIPAAVVDDTYAKAGKG
jgi:hypothetical protein